MDVRFAQISDEPVLQFRGQFLVAQKHHPEFVQGGMDFLHFAVGQCAGQIHAADFRTDMRGTFLHSNGIIRHSFIPPDMSGC